jgi:hypothetical protein
MPLPRPQYATTRAGFGSIGRINSLDAHAVFFSPTAGMVHDLPMLTATSGDAAVCRV